MSQENVEIAARFYEPTSSKAELLAAMPSTMALCHADVEWTVPEDGTTYRGRDGVRQRLEDWLESFDEYRYEVQRIIDCGGCDVLVEATEIGRGAASGAEARSTNYELLTIRDGLIVRIREYYDEGEAFAAGGLSELSSLAQTAFGALNAGDLDGFMAVATEDVEFTSMIAEVEGTTFQGHDGIEAWWETVVEAFGEVRWEILDVRDFGDRGIAHVRMDGTLGGIPLNLKMWLAARLREGKVTRWSWYRTEQEALEAVSLSE